MNNEEIKVGDGIKFQNRYGKVCKINGEKALCRFFGFSKWVEIRELVKDNKWV
jgi:hypothetical protein